ncbi:protein kinase [Streptomyces sp. NPDC005963]|uniref:serine/threonine-protein kinase n=1 Tax=Streptomyces sp. NPDC005963 TaxID=3156721 RepID=UPI0033E22BD1
MSGGDAARRVIDGRFELEARLGGGGMGTVWRARDLVLDRAVALKEVRPPDPGLAEYDPEAARLLRARVLREARALARVEHPNVVTIHHVVDGGDDTYPWLVMELVTGGSLQDRLARGPMAPVEAATLGLEISAALRAAHDVGIQHRDVKPANVLLRPDGRPVLTDFGIAAIRESTVLTATGSLIGTPDYMAPERIAGQDGGPGSDLWSLAMMLYVAVEGNHPLRRGTTLATLAAVLNEELPPPRQAGPLTAVLSALLVRDPAARPDAESVDRMLAAAARGESSPPGYAPLGFAPPAFAPDETSYRLAPAGVPPTAPLGTFGPPVSHADAVPPYATGGHGGLPPTVVPPSAPPRRSGLGRRTAVVSSLLATTLIAVLVWNLLPEPDDGKKTSATPGGAASPSNAKGVVASPSGSGAQQKDDTPQEQDQEQEKGEPDSLLTPAGLRLVTKELKAKAGTDQVGRFVVYPEYASAWTMVKGSKTRYDSYDYRVGQGTSRGLISGTLMGGEQPVGLDTYDWDVLPALIKRAERDLGVKNPTSRYVVLSMPNSLRQSPAGISVYLSDAYGSGYLLADRKGKVLRTVPATQ